MIFTPFEPKVAFRFQMIIDGIPSYVIKAAAMPVVDNSQIVIDHINTDFKVKGKSRWQDISITLYDGIEPDSAKAVHNWLLDHHNSESGIDGYAFSGYKKDITFEALDPKTAPVEIWTLYGAYVKDSNFGQMDWSSDEAKQIEVTLSYDYAVLG